MDIVKLIYFYFIFLDELLEIVSVCCFLDTNYQRGVCDAGWKDKINLLSEFFKNHINIMMYSF